MKHSEGTFRGSGNLALFYQSWHPEGQPRATLVIVHGFGEHGGRYPNVVKHFVPRGYALYALDHRGHGRSPGPRGHINAWSEYRDDVHALVQLVTARESPCPIFLWGHSLGGLIVLEYALHYSEHVRGVIASAPLLGQAGISPLLLALARILSRLAPTFSQSTGLDATTLSRDPDVVKAYTSDPLVHSLGTPRLGTEITAAQEWTQAHARAWRVPLLLFFGTADRLVPPENTRRFFDALTFPDKHKIEYEGAYHEPHNDIIHAQVMADVERWLETHL